MPAYRLFVPGQSAQKAEGFLHSSTNEANGNRYLALEEIFCLLALLTISVFHLQTHIKPIMKKINQRGYMFMQE